MEAAGNFQPVESPEAIQETERSLLDEIVKGRVDFGEVRTWGLRAEDFYTETHQSIFEAMERLHDSGNPIDLLSLHNELGNAHRPDGGDWGSYLRHLDAIALPMGAVKFHVTQIMTASHFRKIAEAGYRLYEAAKKGDAEDVEKLSERLSSLRNMNTGTGCRLKPVSAADLSDIEPPESLWAGLLYPGCITQLNSEPGAGKSTIAYNIAGLGAQGADFIGESFPRTIKTLYIDLETPPWLRPHKIESICGGRPRGFHLLSELTLSRDVGDLLLLCKKEQYDLVILDTQSRVLGLRDENDNSEANRAAALLTRLAKDTGAAVILIHHTSKGGSGKDVYKGRGASALSASVDIVANLEVLDPDTVRIAVVKSRIPAEFQSLTLRKVGGDRFEFVSAENKKDSEMNLIQRAIEKLTLEGGNVNQSVLVSHFKGKIAEKRLRSLLRQGKGRLWEATKGEHNETVYKIMQREPEELVGQGEIQFGSSAPLSACQTAELENINNGNVLRECSNARRIDNRGSIGHLQVRESTHKGGVYE